MILENNYKNKIGMHDNDYHKKPTIPVSPFLLTKRRAQIRDNVFMLQNNNSKNYPNYDL